MEAGLKSRCDIDLSFPLHGDNNPAAHLRAVADFMEAEGYGPEAYLAGPSVVDLEAQVAELLGKQDAMWCATGTLAQGVAARIHAEATGRKDILLHPTSHLELHEHHGYRHAHGLEARLYGDWHETLTADDLEPAACAFVELGQRHNGGALPDWEVLVAIKARARELGVKLHMDGARLWAARTFYDGRSLAEIADGFDTVYVSFYKDIGASGGAVLAGDAEVVEQARIWRGRLGGNLVSAWPMVPDALRLLDTRLAQMPDFVARARAIAAAVDDMDGLTVTPNPPHTNQMHVRLPCDRATAERARDAAAEATGVWLGNRFWHFEHDPVPALELTVGERALEAPLQSIVDALEVLGREASR